MPSHIAARFAFAFCLAIFIFIDVPGYIRLMSTAPPATAKAAAVIIIALVILNFVALAGVWFKSRLLILILDAALLKQFAHIVHSPAPLVAKISVALLIAVASFDLLFCLALMTIESKMSKMGTQIPAKALPVANYIRDRAKRHLYIFNVALLMTILALLPAAWESLSNFSGNSPLIARGQP